MIKRTVLPLIGSKALRALNGYHALILGMKMSVLYKDTSYEEFLEALEAKSAAEKESFFRKAVAFVQLAADEIEAMISFTADSNGVPYTAMNVKNLSAAELHESIVAVCMEFAGIEVNLVSADEKKNSVTTASTSESNS